MKLKRSGAALSVLAASTLLLSACGSDNNTGATGSTGSTGAGSTSNVECGGKSALKGSGSTAQANAMTRFVNAFEQACSGQTLNYTSNGSGAGVSEFIGNQTDIGGSDSPLSKDKGEYDRAKERCASDAWNLPVVFGPLAVTYNVKGVDDLVLDGPTAAKIFNGAITTWDDPAIKALNEGASLPSEKINVIYRNDESGTTDNFQKYLDAASNGAWTSGAGSDFTGGVGEGAKGSAGVAQAVATAPGSITYVEKSFADQNKLSVAEINTGSEAVALTNDSAAKSIAGAKFKSDATGDLTLDLASIFKTNEAGAYPLVLATYSIVCSKGYDADTTAAVKSFLTSAANEGQANLAEQGYVPLPANVQDRLNASITAIS